jgi:predicted nucleic acid-binding protein
VPYNLLDSSGWIEVITGGEERAQFETVAKDVENILVSTVVVVEVGRFILRKANQALADLASTSMSEGIVVGLDLELAERAVRCGLEYGLPITDSIIYATALAHDATLWTMDEHFEKLPKVKYIKPRKKKTK